MINEFKKLKWFLLWALLMAGYMFYSNLTGSKVMSFNNQTKWAAGGPGYHK